MNQSSGTTMNGDIPSVPIITLAGVSSLTNVLLELPLPSTLPQTVTNKSLLYHPLVVSDVQRVLSARPNTALVQQLCSALRQTNTDHIELNDDVSGVVVDDGDGPLLLKAILAHDPQALQSSAYHLAPPSGKSGCSFPPQHDAAYLGAVQPTGEAMGFQPTHNGQYDGYHEVAYQQQGMGYTPQMQSCSSADYIYSMNGVTQHAKPVTVGQPPMNTPVACSPAQAAAAPAVMPEQSAGTAVLAGQYGGYAGRSMVDEHHMSSQMPCSPRVVCEPIRSDVKSHPTHAGYNTKAEPVKNAYSEMTRSHEMVPKIALTRVDDMLLKEHRKHRLDVYEGAAPIYNVVSSDNNQKLTLKLSKTKDEPRGLKRARLDDSDVEYDDQLTMAQMQEVYGEYATSLTERVKRRRNQHVTHNDVSDDNDSNQSDSHLRSEFRRRIATDDSSSEASSASLPEASRPLRKDKRPQRRLMELSVCLEELMDTPTFKRFNTALDGVLEAAEDMDLASIRDDDDETATNSESVVSKSQLSELCSEAAKLKSMGVMNQLPCEKLIKALTILQFNIRDGSKIIPGIDADGDNEDDYLWRELAFERVQSALDAALTALYIMTSNSMPKEVFIEDVIERVVRMSKMQLYNAVYPEFDPVYRVDPRNKSGIQSNIKLKRAKSSGTKNRTILSMYTKLTELTALLAELVDTQELTDTIVLQMSTLAVSPFFVENVSEIQLNALKLVTCIFSRYEKHRRLILEDILSSLARLPSSKKNLRSYRLNADEHIQMVTALALQLIQCVVKLPSHINNDQCQTNDLDELGLAKKKNDFVDKEVMILTSYETAMRTAHNFLAVFLAKCTSKGEEDYRPLFENFVYDLLSTVNKPDWPAAELILSLLGNLLVKQFSCKSVEMSLRVASLDYLGIVAARLRKDAVSSQLNESVISEIITQVEDSPAVNGQDCLKETMTKPNDVSRTELLQKALLEYLAHGSENDPSLVFVRQFYIAQWYRDCTMEAEKAAKKLSDDGSLRKAAETLAKQQQVNGTEKSDDDEDDDDDEFRSENKAALKKATAELDSVQELQRKAERRKTFLMQLIAMRIGSAPRIKSSQSKLDYESVLLVTHYLASNRPFSQSFDIYLTQILKVLCETAVAVRTKALKCLTAVIEADPAILARTDMQVGVHGRFLDQSTAVREAAIELVGKFILIRPELTAQYYSMLSERILDTGISVRKRVIKIFRDVCIEQPEFPKIPEMCVKMIRRVNDEEGIRKLVKETFQSMWFMPVRGTKEATASRLLQRVVNITDVVAACRDTGFEWLEQLLDDLLKKEEDCREKPIEIACTQIVDCLVENVLQLEEKAVVDGRGSSSRLVSCFSTLYLFCKVKPSLLVSHCTTIQPYLDIRCSSQEDMVLLSNVTRILELAVPLIEHPSETFLAQLEEDMMKLILKHGMMILQSCISCLGAVVNGVTHNYKLVKDCFQKFFGVVAKIQLDLQGNPDCTFNRPTLLRSLFTVGLLCKNFDFDSENFGEKKVSIRDRVFSSLLFFLEHHDEEVQLKALTGLGFLVTHHYEFMLHKQLRDPYHHLLTHEDIPIRMCCQVLRNLQTYLVEEELKMMKADAEWRKVHDKEDLKELGDVQSGMASTIIQVYLKQVLESFFHMQSQVRMCALEVVVLILRQGLVHPVQCVPYLICMSSDVDVNIRLKADQQLLEIDKKYTGFIQMKAMQGVKMSYRLHELLQRSDSSVVLRGARIDDVPISLNSYLYSLIRGNRSQRRGLLTSLLNMFDDTAKTPLNELIYIADNLAYFPYQQQDEPLFIMHQLDIIVSVSGSNLLQSFKELLYPSAVEVNNFDEEGNVIEQPRPRQDDDDDEDLDSLTESLPDEAVQALFDLYLTSQGCVLLLVLKQHLKDMYGFTDSKIQRYSPTDSAKTFEKPVNRKAGVKFHPKQVLDLVRLGTHLPEPLAQSKRQLLEAYIDFKLLMMSIDPDDDDEVAVGGIPNGNVVQPRQFESRPYESRQLEPRPYESKPYESRPFDPSRRSIMLDPETGLLGPGPDADASTPLRLPMNESGGFSTPSSLFRPSSSLHKLSTSERRRGRPPGSLSISRSSKLLKGKPKKKKKRWNVDGSDSDSDDCTGDPDWS